MASTTSFTRASTAADVAAAFPGAAKGKTVLITGTNCGIGYEIARVLACHGADVVAACRSTAVAEETAAKLRADAGPDAHITPLVVDLCDLTQVRAAAAAFVASGKPLHILILNAGVMMTPQGVTKDGLELQFGL